jgi:hypothetical protein
MIYILFGPGGSGKSLGQMLQVERELVESRRNVVTNLAIKLPEFVAYLERKYPGKNIDPVRRIRILSQAETWEFWKYRGNAPVVSLDAEGNYVFGPEDRGEFGVAYFIDEAGACGFSATGWATKEHGSTRGSLCMWYLDQQRKFSDNVYASTNGRAPTTIAKPFRDKAHEFWKFKNHYQAKFGPFKGMPKFVRTDYSTEPGPNVEPIGKRTFRLEKGGVCDCYRTQDGMGVTGLNNADIGAKAKGIPIWMVWPMVAAAGAACVFVPWVLGKGLQRGLVHGHGHTVSAERGERAPGLPASRPIEDTSVVFSGVEADGNSVRVCVVDEGWTEADYLVRPGLWKLRDGRLARQGPPGKVLPLVVEQPKDSSPRS